MRTGVMALGILAVAAGQASAGAMGRVSEPAEQLRCRVVEQAARTNSLPVGLLTRLLWVESRFEADAISPKGALGVAQFMPATADERGLSDPLDPVTAIPQAARLLAELSRRFENIGMAIAAYNAGSKHVSDWLAGTGALPKETQNFVVAVTGRTPAEWLAAPGYQLPSEPQSCLAVSASFAADAPKHGQHVQSGYGNPYGGSSDRLREASVRDSQYYIGYRKLDGSHDPSGRDSQYYIGYHDLDGSNRD